MSRPSGIYSLEPSTPPYNASHALASSTQVALSFFLDNSTSTNQTLALIALNHQKTGFRDMAVRGWTPINWVVAGTDDEGNDVYKVVQLPLLPPKRQPPVCHCLGHDRLTHNHHFDEYEEEEEEEPNSSALATSPPKTPATPKTGVKKTQPKPKQVEYQVYSVDSTDQAMIDGDPDLLHHENIYRLAEKYNMAELAEAVNASHNTTKYTAGFFGNRLQRAVNRKAERDGIAVSLTRQELQKVQQENGVPLNGRKRKTVLDEIEKRKTSKKRAADGQIEDKQVAKKQKSDDIAENKGVAKKRVLPWEIPQPSSPNQNRQKPVGDGEGKQMAKRRVLPWEMTQPSLPSQDRQQVPKKQIAVGNDEGKELARKWKPVDDGEDTKLAKKPNIAEKIGVELDKENEQEKEASVGKEENVAKDQAKPDREVLSSGFVIWNI